MLRLSQGHRPAKEAPQEGVPNDLLEARFSALDEFDSLLLRVEDSLKGLLEAFGDLKAAAGHLAEGLDCLPRKGCACNELLGTLLQQLVTCFQESGSSQASFHAVRGLTGQIRGQNAQARRICLTRRKAWVRRQCCNEEADETCEGSGSHPVSSEERSARSKAQREAEELFREHTKEARQILGQWKEHKWVGVQPIVAELRSCCTSAFGDVQEHGEGLDRCARNGVVPFIPASVSMNPSDTGGVRPPSSRSKCTELSDSPPQPVRLAEPTPWSPQKGDSVEVWITSAATWLPGTVEDVLAVPHIGGNFRVPLGGLKVSNPAGVKFVRAEDVSTTVRPPARDGQRLNRIHRRLGC